MKKILWFRHDLRIEDNEAFNKACNDGEVLPIFIYDDVYWKLETSSSFHLNFTKESLEELNNELISKYNSKISIFYGNTIEILNKLINQFKITDIFTNQIFRNKYTLDLDQKCSEFFVEKGVNWHQLQQFGIQLENRKRNYWANQWNKFIDNGPQTIKANCKFLTTETSSIEVKTNQIDGLNIQKGGRTQALSLLNSFLEQRSENYQKEMSSPITGEVACSRLSPHITYGTISLREINHAIDNAKQINMSFNKVKSLRSFRSRLAWHCHFIQKLYDEPEIEYQNMNRAYDGIRENDFNEQYHQAWKDGLTGYPFVDACMRYLKSNGWINFRMRAMLVSFASYQLWLDWRKTSKHLARLFTDYEPGIHYSQFQMQSGTTGINTIRIYNPIKQSTDQDPEGEFIKRWVPELKEIPNKLVHEPWKLTYIDQKGLGIEIGKHYPNPIVDHHSSSKIARDKIWMVKKTEEAKFNAKKILEKHASAKGRR
ncbi:deoxyribodipyrimidine photo-lyase/cryptochrome family protein [Candidatus Pelagibacter sp. HIMB1611]|uniref:cryptochrome/deoxyribodipyrimidine photo-lyase family protein n=1 Tax=unclassified Candidatus Pelagibacter TaxID=2647897 RepID=UPI003F866C05